jgi:hypothetical protein
LIAYARHGFHESLLPRHDEAYDKLDASTKERTDRFARNQRAMAVGVAVACAVAYAIAVMILLLRILARTAGTFDFVLLAVAAAILVVSIVYADKPLTRVRGRHAYHGPPSIACLASVRCAWSVLAAPSHPPPRERRGGFFGATLLP